MIQLDSFKSDVSETNSVKFTEPIVITAAGIRRKLRILKKVGLFARHYKFYSSSSCMKVSKKIPLVFENQIVFQPSASSKTCKIQLLLTSRTPLLTLRDSTKDSTISLSKIIELMAKFIHSADVIAFKSLFLIFRHPFCN